ncbi:hypothetical protein L1987_18650 [Smallanthus sonchifolius]|uniref:Uncharacterized protein n=1 Tax=Smallanthus sonchifolius TaxID=185202 RepID=A0ACB9J0W9_9ASTR|nr:hypothetical protein L1987_18650 [Smallanthus sonchifolius]
MRENDPDTINFADICDVVDGGGVELGSGLSTVSCIGAFSDVVDGGGVELGSSCWCVGEDKRLTPSLTTSSHSLPRSDTTASLKNMAVAVPVSSAIVVLTQNLYDDNNLCRLAVMLGHVMTFRAEFGYESVVKVQMS